MSGYEPSSGEIRMTQLASPLAAGFYREFVDALPLDGSERVLDFGSGSGACSQYLARRLCRGGELTCVDVSQAWQRVIRRKLSRCDNVRYACGEIDRLPLPDGAYDAVFVHFVLHDIPVGDRPDVTGALARKLRPGGLVFLREPTEGGAFSLEETRRLMHGAGLTELSTGSEQHWYTGPVFWAFYQKDSYA